ncbi:EVE domain-containing protein [Paraferrimonas sp. SM1919]|uniref:EVE domain-containing protein n=1 Tax=Paraferrimonas sp. SM1919 TaxID=2662263 RepID=UPI0013D5D5A0|nr:EVE domain-containing protein [Paraferrimonas sp. SM1919]
MNYWLIKSEPDAFSIDDLSNRPNQTEAWDGVRNYQARNMMRDQMQIGDQAFFYHSSCKVPAIVGIVEVVSQAYADPSQFDPNSKYYDAKSTKDNPRWQLVDFKLVKKFTQIIPLSSIKADPRLNDMPLVKKGSRLSIMPISAQHWQILTGN